MSRRIRVTRVLWAVLLGLLAPRSSANEVLDWNAVMMAAVRIDNTGPTLSTRNLAILHLAIYDAVNSIARDHQPYRFQPTPPDQISIEAAVAAAGYRVIQALYPSIQAEADDTFDTWLASVPLDTALTNGVQLGTRIAQLMLAERADDGASTEVPYIPSDAPGEWRRTPPFFRPPLTPQWRYVRPFALSDLTPFVPPPPPELDSPEYAQALNEVKALGSKTSTTRTAEESRIAVFWSDFSYTAMPPGHWHEIAAGIARARGTDLVSTARLMALLSMAQADAAIVCWEAKFRYNLWRPVTAIQRADEDGNDDTQADAAWDHYLASPPFPAYTSGHSTFSKASAEVLAGFYGTDSITFTAASDSLPGVLRQFDSLSRCADEVGMSRIYGGIHFAFDNVRGKQTGEKVADFVIKNYLLPNRSLPFLTMLRYHEGQVDLRVQGQPGSSLVVETSTDLVEWYPTMTNRLVTGELVTQIPSGTSLRRYFRARAEHEGEIPLLPVGLGP